SGPLLFARLTSAPDVNTTGLPIETMRLDTGLIIEVWSKGMLWDKLLGLHWLPLRKIPHSSQEGVGKWLFMDSELIMQNGEVMGTRGPTGHSVLIDARFELPYDVVADLPESEAAELQNKLEVLNTIMDAEIMQLKEQQKRQTYSQWMSEDSDYTSDVNYPLQHQHNSSAHQFQGEPSYPLRHENGRERSDYKEEYFRQSDSFERDFYDEREHSFEQMESFDQERGDSFDQEISFEHQGSFDQDVTSDRYYDTRDLEPRDFEPRDFDSRVYESRSYEPRERDYYHNGSPYHLGRSDTDSEPLFYNSRPNTSSKPPLPLYPYNGPDGSPADSHGSHDSRVSSVTRQSTQDFRYLYIL
ncbi:hypothetical protein ACJMK2_043393, partial [Sinanodonta woodiana]